MGEEDKEDSKEDREERAKKGRDKGVNASRN